MKKIKQIILQVILSFVIITNCNSQNWQWAKHFGSVNGDAAGEMCVDQTGNIYLTGQFALPQGIFGSDTITTQGAVDGYIVKYNSNGNFIWAKRAGGYSFQTSEGDGVSSIAYEALSNTIIVTGTMDGTSQVVDSCHIGSGNKVWLSKLDLNGNCIWSVSQAFGSQADGGIITVDNSGSIYMICGNTNYTYINGTFIPAGCFLAKFNSLDGACVWAKKIINPTSYPTSLKYFNNNLYMGGGCSNDTVHLDTATIYAHKYDTFISKFDTAGNVLWLKTMGGPNVDLGGTLDLDGNGNIYTTGYFTDTAYFGSTMLTNGTNKDWYIAKYRNNGNLVWVKQAHSTANIDFGRLSTDHNGNTYASGLFSGAATFGSSTVTATSASDMFITRYDSSGVCLGVRNVNVSSIYGNGGDVITNTNGGCYVSNNFQSTANFDANGVTSYGNYDIYLAKLNAITGIDTKRAINNNTLVIYANPNKGTCNITVPDDLLHEDNLVLKIFDTNGKLIQQLPVAIDQEKVKINIQEEATGIYNVTLGNSKKIYSGKIVFE